MSRVRQMPSTKGSATKGAANRRSYLESRRNSSAGKQCKYRFAGYSFFLRHARSRTRRDLPASCVFLLSAPVSASVLCNFPSRRFDECLRRDLEPLINPRARAWRRDGPSLNKLAAHRAINQRTKQRNSHLTTRITDRVYNWIRERILVVSMDTDYFLELIEKIRSFFIYFVRMI